MSTDDLFVDDFWYDDDGFVGYVENTKDPGENDPMMQMNVT
jgi:hypothetical protein